ncbi:MAG: hypothetical protein WBF45_00830, partial [Acidobacteriaceae bacterium]
MQLAWLLGVAALGFFISAVGYSQTSATISNAQKVSQPVQQAGPTEAKSTEKEKKKKKKKKLLPRGSIAAAPIPISSPAIGSGIVPVVGYIF